MSNTIFFSFSNQNINVGLPLQLRIQTAETHLVLHQLTES